MRAWRAGSPQRPLRTFPVLKRHSHIPVHHRGSSGDATGEGRRAPTIRCVGLARPYGGAAHDVPGCTNPAFGGGAMIGYILRRLLYAIPILIGVNLLTFVLFFFVNSPDDMARLHLGAKTVTPEAIVKWKEDRGYNKPLLYNAANAGAD